MAARFVSLTRDFHAHPEETVDNLLGLGEIFGQDLPVNKTFRTRMRRMFQDLCSKGVKSCIELIAANG